MILYTDNECTNAGWTEARIEMDEYDLHISHAPGTDIGSRFTAFCHDTQSMININGWIIGEYEVINND